MQDSIQAKCNAGQLPRQNYLKLDIQTVYDCFITISIKYSATI